MCNPRKVKVEATRKIAEAWQAEINRAATARGSVTSEARLTQSIADLLPPRARVAFEQAMRSSPDWEQAGDEYRMAVPGGVVVYRPDSGELEIAVQLSAAIEAAGTATLSVSGQVEDEISAEATVSYYDDGYAGRDKRTAQREAQLAADAELAKLAPKRLAALKREAEEAARHELDQRGDEAMAEAKRSAEHQLTLRATELQNPLDLQAGQRLEEVQEETLKGIFQLVAAGYSAALQEYAAQHGENLQVSEEEGVIAIEFELER
ncbi:hypothetical protein ACWEGE_39065 [Amycolatopsis sp. NPDC004747]